MVSLPNNSMPPYSQAWYDYQKTALGEAACRQLGFFVIPGDFVLSVIVPVFNEASTLNEIIDRVTKVPINKEIIVVDDASSDSSNSIAKQLPVTHNNELNTIQVISHPSNLGKGAAIRSGLKLATGNAIVIQDADLEYDPAELPKLIQPLVEGNADVVFGSRFLGDQPRPAGYLWSYLGNRWITRLSNLFTGLHLTDMESCYKLISKEVVEQIEPSLSSNRFAIEPEITARIARTGARVFEVPVSYQGRTFKEGKKIRVRDAVEAVWAVVRFGLFKR